MGLSEGWPEGELIGMKGREYLSGIRCRRARMPRLQEQAKESLAESECRIAERDPDDECF
jgi:hypothetical protein